MSFDRPEYLLALILVLVPAGMALSHYVRSTRASFPAVWFLFGRDRKPLARLRLRQALTTLVRAGLLAAVVLAFSEPHSELGGAGLSQVGSPRLLILLDVSASMGAVADGLTPLDEAVRQALSRVEALPDRGRAALVECPGPTPRRLLWLTRPSAKRQLENVVQGYGRCQPDRMLAELAPQLPSQTRVLYVGDLAGAPEEAANLARLPISPERIETVQVALPTRPDNLSLVELIPERTFLTAIIANQGTDAEGELALSCADRTEKFPFRVPAGTTVSVRVAPSQQIAAGLCSIYLPQDGIAADNVLWVEFQRRDRLNVVLVDGNPAVGTAHSPSFFLAAAMRSSGEPVVTFRISQPEFSFDTAKVADMLVLIDPQPMPSYLEQRLAEFVRGGGRLWLLAGSQTSRWNPDNQLLPGVSFRSCVAVAEHPFLLGWYDRADPALAFLQQAGESLAASWTSLRHVAPSLSARSTRVLARFTDQVPAFLKIPSGRGEILLWSMVPDADNGDFAYHPLFPLAVTAFLKEALPPSQAWRLPPSCVVGRTCRPLPPADTPRRFEAGDDPRTFLGASSAGEVLCSRPGPYVSVGKAGRELAFSCRIPDEELSAVPLPAAHVAAVSDAPSGDAPNPLRRRHGPLFLLVAMVLVLLESWLVGGRRFAAR